MRAIAALAAGCLCVLALPPVAEPTPQPVTVATADSLRDAAIALLESRGEIFQPQFAIHDDGRLLMVWRQASGRQSDLFLAVSTPEGAFSAPIRVNEEPGSVPGMDLDEARPVIALGPAGQVAVVWSGRGSILAAVASDADSGFGPTHRLDGAPGPSYRGFASAAFDLDGGLHVGWIDARDAPSGMEEPADLYYATLRDGTVEELNLTAGQEASICGCCRTHLDVDGDGRVRITFRNTTEDGYRDIFVIAGDLEGEFGESRRVGPEMWELRGCPVQGPITVGETTLWNEASTGKRRLLAAKAGEQAFSVVLEDREGWRIMSPPRTVAGSDGGLLLVPGRPDSVILQRAGSHWNVAVEAVPAWAHSAARIDGEIIVLGSVSGKVSAEVIALR